jgi:hypothetical protein
MEVALCVPTEVVAGKSAADDCARRGDKMEAAFATASNPDVTPRSHIRLMFCPMRLLAGKRSVQARARQAALTVQVFSLPSVLFAVTDSSALL